MLGKLRPTKECRQIILCVLLSVSQTSRIAIATAANNHISLFRPAGIIPLRSGKQLPSRWAVVIRNTTIAAQVRIIIGIIRSSSCKDVLVLSR